MKATKWGRGVLRAGKGAIAMNKRRGSTRAGHNF